MDQIVIQFTEKTSGSEDQRVIAVTLPDFQAKTDGNQVAVNVQDLPANVQSAINTIKNHFDSLM